MPKRISAADATPDPRRHRHAGQSSGERGRARARAAAQRDCRASSSTSTPPPNGARRRRALDRCRADIARADIVLATMLFMEDHVRAVLPALRRGATTATRWSAACRPARWCSSPASASSRMDGASRRRRCPAEAAARQEAAAAASSGARQMKMLRQLPQLLRFIPGTAQDVRAYFLTLQYWLAGSDENVANLVRFLVDRYADGARRALRGTLHGRARRRLSGGRRSTTRACRAASPSGSTQLPRPPARAGTRRPAADALLRAGRQHRALRRRDRGAGSARPARDPGLRQRASTRARRSSASSCSDGRAGGRRAGLAHRLLARRRPRLQRRARRPRRCWRGSTCPTSPRTPVEFQTLEQWEGSDARPDAGRSDDDGGDPRARRRHRRRWCSAAAPRARRREQRARHARRIRSAPTRSPRASRSLVALRRTRAGRAQGRDRAVQLPAECRQRPARRRILSVFASLHQHAARRCRPTATTSTCRPSVDALRDAHPRRQCRALRRRTPTSTRASRPTITCAASATCAEIEAQWGPAPGPPAERRRARSSCSASSSATSSSACSRPSATRATRCGCCSSSGFAPTHAFSAFYR